MAALFSFSTSWSMTPCLSPSNKGQKGRRRLPCWPPNAHNTLQLYTMTESHTSRLQPDVGKVSNKYCSAVCCIQARLPMEHERLVTGSKHMENEAKLEPSTGHLTDMFTCWTIDQTFHKRKGFLCARWTRAFDLFYQLSSTEQGFSLGTLGYISYNTVNIKNSDITDSHLMGWDLVYQGTKYFHYSLITDSKTCCLWYTEGQHTLSRGPSLALLWTVWLLQGQFRRLFLVTIVEVKYFTATVCWHFFY